MYNTILLAYDGTLEGRLALREGALLAKTCGAEVVLLAVIDTAAYIPVVADAGVAYVPRDQSEDYQRILDEGTERLRRIGIRHSARLKSGDPVTCICDTATEIGADLVVVGHHKQGALARWLLGSVTASLIDRLPCSLLSARQDISDEALYG
jgi:nucleotide-binding universal stress UspA family protein